MFQQQSVYQCNRIGLHNSQCDRASRFQCSLQEPVRTLLNSEGCSINVKHFVPAGLSDTNVYRKTRSFTTKNKQPCAESESRLCVPVTLLIFTVSCWTRVWELRMKNVHTNTFVPRGWIVFTHHESNEFAVCNQTSICAESRVVFVTNSVHMCVSVCARVCVKREYVWTRYLQFWCDSNNRTQLNLDILCIQYLWRPYFFNYV